MVKKRSSLKLSFFLFHFLYGFACLFGFLDEQNSAFDTSVTISSVKSTGKIAQIPLSEAYLGRVVSASPIKQ